MRTCPDCYIELAMSNREGVQIDYCTTCRGIWLDHGELEKIIQLAARAPYQAHSGHQQSHPQHYESHPNQYSQAHSSHHVHHDHHHHDHRKHDNYKHGHHGHYKKHKHEHPVADFLEDVFDIFG